MAGGGDSQSDPGLAANPPTLRGGQAGLLGRSWAWPRSCELCASWGRRPLCSACVQRFAPADRRCERCAIRLATDDPVCGDCLHQPPTFDRALAAVDYAWPWNQLLTRFKFHAQPELAGLLAERMIDVIDRQGSLGVDLLVPIPLSDQRLGERGYNQSWELARRIGRRLRIATQADGLTRGRDTPHQVGLLRSERAANLRHSMWAAPASARMQGRRVALIDDVMTTGATAEVAAQAMRAAGAEQVQVWVLARTPRA